jgi:cell division protein FtsW (lipid II flippase)
VVLLSAAGATAIIARDDYQLDRIQAVFNGNDLEQEDNYQPIQARITLGSGGFAGRGLGQSRQKMGFLPEAHTDFILAVIGEEFGFAGTFSVLVLFGVLFVSALSIARSAGSAFDALAGTGLTAVLITGVMIHTLVNTGVIPVTGMPLPLISWGGSAMLVNLVCIGVLSGMATRTSP